MKLDISFRKMKQKTKIIKIEIGSVRKALRKFAMTFEKIREGRKVRPYHGIYFESIDGLRNVLTNRRLELISVVRKKKPKSIYQLSKMLKRDLKSVNNDVQILKSSDFITFKRVNEGRKRVIPIVEFDKIDIMVKV